MELKFTAGQADAPDIDGRVYVRGKLPQRDGEVPLSSLSAPVSVRFDERGVPHIRAQNEADLYRALGWQSTDNFRHRRSGFGYAIDRVKRTAGNHMAVLIQRHLQHSTHTTF